MTKAGVLATCNEFKEAKATMEKGHLSMTHGKYPKPQINLKTNVRSLLNLFNESRCLWLLYSLLSELCNIINYTTTSTEAGC